MGTNKVYYYVYWENSWWEILNYPDDNIIETEIKNGIKISEEEMIRIVGVVPSKFSIYVGFYG